MPLQDSDNFIVGRGTDSYKITYQDLKDDLNYVPPPSGTIDQPTVLEPNDGAGGGDTRYLKSDAITDVEGSGIKICETDTIQSVDSESNTGFTIKFKKVTTGQFGDVPATVNYASLPDELTSQAFDTPLPNDFFVNAVVKLDNASGISFYRKGSLDGSVFAFYRSDTGANGSWIFDSYGTADTENFISTKNKSSYWLIARYPIGTAQSQVEDPFNTETVESWRGDVWYVGAEVISTTLTFPTSNGFDCFEPGDVVQDPDVKVISKDADVNTITVDGGKWDTSNQSQVWSANTIGNVSKPWTNGFNGVLNTTAADNTGAAAGEETTVNFPDLEFTKLRVWGAATTQAYFKVNGVETALNAQGGTNAWTDISSSVTSPLQSITLSESGGEGAGFGAIEVDGKILVDAVNDSQVWSNNLYSGTTTYDGTTTTKNFQPDAPATNAFDGNLGTAAYENGSSNWIYFRPSSPITVTSKVEFYTRNTVEIKVNGDDKTYTGGDSSWNFSKRSVDSFTGQLTEFAIRDLDNTGSSGLAALWVDGAYVLDQGARNLGDTKLVKETPYDTTLTLASDKDLADMAGSVFGCSDAYGDGPFTQTPYKLVTTDIESVSTISWTETGDWNPSGPVTYMFDGDITTFTFANTNSSAAVDFQNVVATKSLRVYGYAGGLIGDDPSAGEGQWFIKANNTELMISGGSYLPEGTSSVKDWVDLSSDFTFPLVLNQVRTAGSQGGVSAIEIDGSLLTQSTTTLAFPGDVSTNPDLQYFKPGDVVQGPSWNQSQTWSANVNNGATPVNAYDGNLATFDYGSSYTNTFTTPLTVSKLRVYADGPQDSVQVYLDGVVVTVSWSGSVTKQWWDVPISGSAVFSQVTITHSSAALYAVEADGKILVDAGIAASGAVKVVSVDPNSNTMVVDGGEWGAYLKGNWSNGASGGINRPGYEPDKAFDGDLTTFFNPEDSQSATFSFTGLTIQNSLRLYCRGDNGNLAVTLGGVQQQITTDTGAAQWRSATVSGPVAFTSIDFASSSPALYAVEVDGKILVDAVEDSQVWSDDVDTQGFTVESGRGPDKGFDGDTDTSCAVNANNDVYYLNLQDPAFASQTVEVYTSNPNSLGDRYVSLNGVSVNTPAGFKDWLAIGTAPSDGTATIGIGSNAVDQRTVFYAVRIGGKILIDKGIRNLGDSRVEYQTKGGQGDIIEVNTDDNTIVLSDTGDRDNRWIKGFSVAGPSVIDEPLLTNDVELRVSDFATTPPGADTLKEIIWSINGTEYSANTTNPWSPLDKLPTNTSVTVKVKYKGNTLEDSDWSPNVTFTTGANMRSLFTRIAALEANDVTDDATDTALLTLIAGLAARIQALEDAN